MAQEREKQSKMNTTPIITESELSLVEDNSLNGKQLKHLLKATPQQYIKSRPAKGGGTWLYVTGGYVKKCLNLMFGWDWDFEIVDEKIMIEAKEVIVKGRLTCRSNGREIIKMQYGNKDIMFRKGTDIPLSVGNDMKAAATDALKKCAAEIGIASDIYAQEDFREVRVTDDPLSEIKELYPQVSDKLTEDEQVNIERIVKEQSKSEYSKALKLLKSKEQ